MEVIAARDVRVKQPDILRTTKAESTKQICSPHYLISCSGRIDSPCLSTLIFRFFGPLDFSGSMNEERGGGGVGSKMTSMPAAGGPHTHSQVLHLYSDT